MAQTRRKVTTITLVDDEIKSAMDKAKAEAKSKTVDIFGEPFEVTTDVNQWLVTRMLGGDIGVINELFTSLLVRKADQPGLTPAQLQQAEQEDYLEQQRLNRVLGRQRGLNSEVLIALLGRITEVVADHPSTPSSGSSRTSAKTDD